MPAEDPNEYRAENIFWIPPAARWMYLYAHRVLASKQKKPPRHSCAPAASRKSRFIALSLQRLNIQLACHAIALATAGSAFQCYPIPRESSVGWSIAAVVMSP